VGLKIGVKERLYRRLVRVSGNLYIRREIEWRKKRQPPPFQVYR
jgi:hypothetical protein